jgi:hypothetical protein
MLNVIKKIYLFYGTQFQYSFYIFIFCLIFLIFFSFSSIVLAEEFGIKDISELLEMQKVEFINVQNPDAYWFSWSYWYTIFCVLKAHQNALFTELDLLEAAADVVRLQLIDTKMFYLYAHNLSQLSLYESDIHLINQALEHIQNNINIVFYYAILDFFPTGLLLVGGIIFGILSYKFKPKPGT